MHMSQDIVLGFFLILISFEKNTVFVLFFFVVETTTSKVIDIN